MSKTQKCSGNIKPSQKKFREFSITAWKKPTFDELQMRYLIFGEEICPETQKLHYQTYVYFYNAKTWDQVTSYFFKKGENRVVPSKGEAWENMAYCSKDEKFLEFGTRPSQGKRVDLDAIRDEIVAGKKVDDIVLEDPILFHQYGRTLTKLEDLVMRKKYRTTMTRGYWLHGPTGCGKSHAAFKNYSPETHYVLCKDHGWWDGYAQQETVIINDFRGWIPYDELLTIVDKWPHSVSRRGREPIPFTSKRVIITSSLSPEEVYHNREEQDDIAQFNRRFITIKTLENCLIDYMILE